MIQGILIVLLTIYIVVAWVTILMGLFDFDGYNTIARAIIWPLYLPRVLLNLGKAIIEEIKNV